MILLDRIEHGAERACIAWHTVSNFYYIVAAACGGGTPVIFSST